MENKPSVLTQRYELGRQLGQGAFAKVYYGRSLQTSQGVAIKVIDKEKNFESWSDGTNQARNLCYENC